MTEELITFETAKLAKEKGFELDKYLSIDDENPKNLNSNYNPRNYQPWYFDLTQSLLQKWLREIHNVEVLISRIPPEAVLASKNSGKNILKNYNCYIWSFNNNPRIANNGSFQDIYEEALEIGLQEGLKLIKL